MKRVILSILLIVLTFSIASGTVYADYKDPSLHPGALKCWPCHARFSYKQPYSKNLSAPIRNDNVLQFRGCKQDDCHDAVRMQGGIRVRDIHTNKPDVCKNCHIAKNGTYQIHTIHLKPESVLEYIPKDFALYGKYNWSLPPDVISNIKRPAVDCNSCHWSPEGYKSSLVNVPPFEETTTDKPIKKTTIRKLPWNNDCGYCHPSVKGAERLHDVHEPVIFKACIVCHSPTMVGRDDLAIQQFGMPFPNGEKKDVDLPKTQRVIKQVRGSLPGREFSRLFEKIAEYMLTIFNTLSK